MKLEREPKALVYIPPRAKMNEGNKPMSPPETEYEARKAVFDKNAVKKVTKGKIGSEDNDEET